MSRRGWNLPDDQEEGDRSTTERVRPALVSLHFVRSALRRRLWVCILCGLIGLAAAVSVMLVFSLPHQANTTLVLTHDGETDSTSAMETNMSLLETRTVAVRAIDELGLTVTPEEFRRTVRVEQLSPELLSLTLTADTDAEAVRRLDVLARVYLDFRAEQLSLQSKVLTDGLRERIRQLQVEVNDLTQQIDRLLADDSEESSSRLGDVIAQRANLSARIDTLQVAVEDATLRNHSVVASSRILDPPEADRGLVRRTALLGLASGLIGGLALGCGGVLFVAITSNRLRQRSDVAEVLGVPVRTSVRRISPLAAAVRWLPGLRQLNRRRAEEQERLAQALQDEIPPIGTARVAVIGLENTDELGFALTAAAKRVAAAGRSTSVIDLTRRGSRGLRRAYPNLGTASGVNVLRPPGQAPLARDTSDLLAVDQWENGDRTPRPKLGEVAFVLTDFDPAVGVDHLAIWTDTVVVVVTAGRSSVERVRTIGELVRSAGLDLRFAGLLHTERTDDSSGLGLGPFAVDRLSTRSPAEIWSSETIDYHKDADEVEVDRPEASLAVPLNRPKSDQDGQSSNDEPLPDNDDGINDEAESSDDETESFDGEAESFDGEAESFDGEAESSDGEAESSDGEAESSDGEAESSDGEAESSDEAESFDDETIDPPAPTEIWATCSETEKLFTVRQSAPDNEVSSNRGEAPLSDKETPTEIRARGERSDHHIAPDKPASHQNGHHAPTEGPSPDQNGHHVSTEVTEADAAGRTEVR